MFIWIPYPFIRFLLFFSLGILAHSFYAIDVAIVYTLFVVALLAYAAGYLLARPKNHLVSAPSLGILAFISLFLGGYLRAYFSTEKNWPDHITHIDEQVSFYAGEIVELPRENENRFNTTVMVTQVNIDGKWQPISGKVKLNSSKSSDKPMPTRGDWIIVHGFAYPIKPSMNPGVFDYRAYLEGQNIFMADFVMSDEWVVYGKKPQRNLIDYALFAQATCAKVIRKYIDDSQAEGILLALVLGLKTGLDDSLQEAYATAGVIHILAVSGLHVGIIYSVLLLCLRWLRRKMIVFATICLVVLWAFAFITGLSPSVMRAATMFSFIVVAKAWGRETNIYNTIAASAFFLLLINPFYLQSVGFQLSYLAVLGIVFLYPKFYPLVYFQSRIADEIWKLMCVSLSAQLAVFPLTTYYFNQFPLYFLLANIVLVPAAFVMLSMGLTLLASSFIPPLATMVGNLLNFIVSYLNHFVFWISYLPLSRLSGLYVSGWQTFILMILLLAVIVFIYYRRLPGMILIMALCVIFQSSTLQRLWKAQDRVITYYSIGHRGTISFSQGGFFDMVNTGGDRIDEQSFKYSIQPGLLRNGRNITYDQIDKVSASTPRLDFPYGTISVWNGYKIMVLDRSSEYKWDFEKKVDIDILILEHEAVRTWDDMPGNLYFKYLVIGNTYKYWTAERLYQVAEKENIQVFHPLTTGAFILNIDEH